MRRADRTGGIRAMTTHPYERLIYDAGRTSEREPSVQVAVLGTIDAFVETANVS
jgi:hypothetical protein